MAYIPTMESYTIVKIHELGLHILTCEVQRLNKQKTNLQCAKYLGVGYVQGEDVQENYTHSMQETVSPEQSRCGSERDDG